MKKYIIYTDGASRGNPGPAGAGVAFMNKRGDVVEEYSSYLGETTNNEAEYRAVVLALKKFKSLFGKKEAKEAQIEVRTDSELVAKQMNGEYKIKEESLQPFFLELWNLRLDFGDVKIVSIPREENEKADMLANQAVDGELGQKRLV